MERSQLDFSSALADAPVQAHHVGLRPGRPEVRLERERRGSDRTVIHNYGHGGVAALTRFAIATP